MTISELWDIVLKNCGEEFYTKTGLPFTYEYVDGSRVKVYREGRFVGYIKRSDMEYILKYPNKPTSEYTKVMRVVAYATALYRGFVGRE